jgi:pimeloyl-ACP methyl ester carboxylesterase
VSAVALETTGAGPPLVLIHGVGTNRSIWSLSLPALAETRAVTTLDLPGFGDSDPPERGWELAHVADTVGAALEDEIAAPFDLIGSSLGGAVALSLAVARPDLVRRLILCAPAGFRPRRGRFR